MRGTVNTDWSYPHMRALPTVAFVIPLMFLAACGGEVKQTEAADSQTEAAATSETGPTGGALRLSVTPDRPSAAYLTLVGGEAPKVLTGVSSPDAERVELHETKREGDMTMMGAVEQIEVPAGGEVAMRPGGLHLMLFGLSEAARSAGSVTLNLTYADGTSETVIANTANLAALEGGAAGGADHGEDHGGDHSGDHSGH
jgi:copper(I)-binding protein